MTTFYLVTNLPAPGSERAQGSELEAARLQEVLRLNGLRRWVEQSRHPGEARLRLVSVSGEARPRYPAALAVGLLRLLVLLVSAGSLGATSRIRLDSGSEAGSSAAGTKGCHA